MRNINCIVICYCVHSVTATGVSLVEFRLQGHVCISLLKIACLCLLFGFISLPHLLPTTEPFEEATYRLRVGQLSEVVDTDSGVHIILRTG